jgi:hypothetical protein
MDQKSRGVRGWAEEEYGSAILGDARRTRRLVKIAEGAMNQPAGQVTAVFEGAEREGTFRLLENDAVDTDAIARAAHGACARRASAEKFVFIPLDGTSLSLTDRLAAKGLGSVGARHLNVSGVQVMTAIAVAPDGVPLGICGQRYWAREEATPGPKSTKKKRPLEQKETKHWLDVMAQGRAVFAEEAPSTQTWFQLDAGADAWPIVLDGLLSSGLITIRAGQDRRVDVKGPARYLWETLEAAEPLTTLELDLPERSGKRGRRKAAVEIRAQEISLRFLLDGAPVASPPVYGLLARETEPVDGEPIEWLLLTSHPVKTKADAKLVVFGYSQRWRVEDFHKAWKSGACKVEDTQLRDLDHIVRWATVLASVALRILRLTYLARHRPLLSADEELTRSEIDAIGLRSRKRQAGTKATIGEAVEELAVIGGYTGRASGGPPGPLVLARGLYDIESLAWALDTGLVRPTGKM